MKHLQHWSEDDENVYTEIVLRTAKPKLKRSSTIRPSHSRSTRSLGELLLSLPTELISEVFRWCTPSLRSQDTSPPRYSLTLTHVCHYWRVIASATPSLWTYTKLSIYDQLLPPALELMKIWLARSGMLPVFIDLDFVDSYSYYRTVLKLFEEVVSVARQFRPAWFIADSFLATHLEVVSTEASPTREEWYFWAARPRALVTSPTTSSPTSLKYPNTSSPSLNPSTLAGNASPPTITIRALRFALGPFVLQPYTPWTSSLTFLIIRDMHAFTSFTNNDAALVLSAFPLLVHCALHITLEDIDDLMEPDAVAQVDMVAVTTGNVRMRHLKSFSLSWSNFTDIGPLLDALTLPVISELELSGPLPYAGDNERWPHLSTLLHRSLPPLLYLTLEHTDCLYLALIECLDFCPALKGLWLDDCIVDDDMIKGLYWTTSSGVGKGVLATLNTLVFRACYLFSLDVLIAVLKAREVNLNPSTPTPTQAVAWNQQDRDNTDNSSAEALMTYVVDCGDLTPTQARMLKRLGMRGLVVGPRVRVTDEGEEVIQLVDSGEDIDAVRVFGT